MSFESMIAMRYVRARRQNSFISFISLVSIVGIALGVAALIIVLSVMNGFQDEVRSRILGMAAHVQITDATGTLDDWQSAAKTASVNPHVLATAPYVYGQGLLTNGEQVKGTLVRGIDPALEGGVNEAAQKLTSGRISDLVAGEFRIVLGWQLASDLGVRGLPTLLLITAGQPASRAPAQHTVDNLYDWLNGAAES